MVKTASQMLPLGTAAPDFDLPDAHGKRHTLRAAKGRPALVFFLCNHCPFVKHIRGGLAALARDYRTADLAMFGINSNDFEAYPDDAPDKMASEAAANAWTFPYLVDADQSVAKAYRAACTPDFFLFDRDHRLVYRGQFDASRPGNDVAVTGADLRAAIDAVLARRPVAAEQRPSIGCNIKWRPGSAPAWFGG
ncbi:MAG TPA: thioredoxin family protein [Planctomycetota bacterium]|nr:thioredoxin family protein [Planctomycetota bacterium]